MPKKPFFEKTCTQYCKSDAHVEQLISLIYQPNAILTDEEIASYLVSTSCCFKNNTDIFGRNVLHAAASQGRRKLCEWLICACKMNVNTKDKESGFTPLHHCLYNGQIGAAISLIKFHADLTICDNDGYVALNTVSHTLQPSTNDKFETYTWGTNANYTTGFSNMHGKEFPQMLEYFVNKDIKVTQVRMQKFHTLFLTERGDVFSCGLGQGGRLGLDSETTFLIPQRISIFGPQKRCISVASGKDHSVFLCSTQSGTEVFVCGTNNYSQLGILPSPKYVTKPTPITRNNLFGVNIVGIAASTYVTIFWTNTNVYCCGLNGGQLNRKEKLGTLIDNWKEIPIIKHSDKMNCIYTVVCSDGATVVFTNNFNLYLYYEDKSIVINLPQVCSVSRNSGSYKAEGIKFDVIGGRIITKETDKNFPPSSPENKLIVAVLNRNRELVYVDEKRRKLIKCSFVPKKNIIIKDFVLNKRGLIIVTFDGFAYNCTFKHYVEFPANNTQENRKLKRGICCLNYNDWITKSKCCDTDPYKISGPIINLYLYNIFNTARIPYVSSATSIFSDKDGDNFAVIQVSKSGCVRTDEIVESPFVVHARMRDFYSKTLKFQAGHDVTYKVGPTLFPAHRYFIYMQSGLLGSLPVTEGTDVVELFGISPIAFQQIHEYIYTHSCTILNDSYSFRISDFVDHSKLSYYLDGKLVHCKSKKTQIPHGNQDQSDIFIHVKYLAQLFGMKDLLDRLNNLMFHNESVYQVPQCEFCHDVNHNNYDSLNFVREQYPSVCDTRIITQDGKQLYAHKCVLIFQCDYFNAVLSEPWQKSNDNFFETKVNVKSNIMEFVLDFIYTGKIPNGLNFNTLCNVMMIADQLLLATLKELCAIRLSHHINVVNVVSIYQFAELYTSTELKEYSLHFIVSNLIAVLESRILENGADTLPDEIYRTYREYFKSVPSPYRVHYSECESLVAEAKRVHEKNPTDITITADDEMTFVAEEQSADTKPSQSSIDGHVRRKLKTKNYKNIDETSNNSVNKVSSVVTKQNDDNWSSGAKVNSMDEHKTVPTKQTDDSNWIEVGKHVKIVKSRLKVIDKLNNEPALSKCEDQLVILTPQINNDRNNNDEDDGNNSLTANQQQPSSSTGITYNIDWSKITANKLSQKKRKQLNNDIADNKHLPCSSQPEQTCSSSPPKPAWVINQKQETNLSDIMASEKHQKNTVKVNTKRSKLKTLEQMQAEDQAIQELTIHYNALNIRQERISVRRVLPENVSAPQWVIQNKK